MATLLVVGAGLFGSQAAAYARLKGYEVRVFDAGLPGGASAAAAGLFTEAWAGKRLKEHFHAALPLLDRLYGLRQVSLIDDDGRANPYWCVPPSAILERQPLRERVSAAGDGWLEAGGRRHDGFVYLAAGIWSEAFAPGLGVYGKAGSTFVFPGERPGRIQAVGPGRQAIAFVREPGTTHFSDGTAEREYTPEHERLSLRRAAALGLTEPPVQRLHGVRPYTPGGPLFKRLGQRTWLATGGRKMGTILGAAFARRLVDEELRSS